MLRSCLFFTCYSDDGHIVVFGEDSGCGYDVGIVDTEGLGHGLCCLLTVDAGVAVLEGDGESCCEVVEDDDASACLAAVKEGGVGVGL